MQLFLEEIPGLLEQLWESIRIGDADRMQLAAHRIKGLASGLDHQETSAVAFELEQLGKNRMLRNAADLCSQLELSLSKLIQAVEGFLKSPVQ